LRALKSTFDKRVFPWDLHVKSLYTEFAAIQDLAGITPRNKPEGTHYGFHDLRRGFATANATTLDLFELQRLMQHKSLATTRAYAAMGHRLNSMVEKLVVPKGVKQA